MTVMLYRMDLEHYSHRGRALYFSADGEMLYGPEPTNLIYPDGMELQGKFPPVTLADVKHAFVLGMQVAQQEV